jgi:4-hydroxybenzoate polyprenyltransferase
MVLLQADKLMSSPNTTSFAPLQSIIRQVAHLPEFFHTLYLFTANDFATFAVPTTLFALFGSLSGPILTTNTAPSLLVTLARIPITLLVVWSNLLIFDISNQRSPSAVEEDKINKPHRPLPSGKITTESSRRLLLAGVPIVLALGWILGCWQETLLLFTATWMYNDLLGCDESWVLRNLMIAIGYGLYSSAALRVMVGPEYALTSKGTQWIAMVTLVMFVTQHVCDIKDAEGDRARGRKSAPVVFGDNMVRWSVAVPILLCSIACPSFLGLGVSSYLWISAMGAVVAGRTLMLRDLKSDKVTWKLWALWTVGLFMLPLVANPTVLSSNWNTFIGLACPSGDCSESLNLAAVSGIALAVEGRRLYEQAEISGTQGNASVPKSVAEGVAA